MNKQKGNIEHLKLWKEWSRRIWKEADSEWVKREGQDLIYHNEVVVPHILEAIKDNNSFCNVVDLGAGDGYPLQKLIEKNRFNLHNCLLIDESEYKLNYARRRLKKYDTCVLVADLQSFSWVQKVKSLSSPKLIISIFVIQELPYLQHFADNLKQAINDNDVTLLVTVAPIFGYNLLKGKGLIIRKWKNTKMKDWKWVAKYPVPTDHKVIYLPYFHRTLTDYRKIFSKSGLKIEKSKYLYLEVKEAKNHFVNTVYENYIFKMPSSLLFEIKLKSHGRGPLK